MDELELILKIRERLGGNEDERVRLGIGDDAAVLAPIARGVVISVDAMVEGVHFERDWLSWSDLGSRTYIAALSDLAAMGASPVAALLSMVLPRELEDDAILTIVEGVRAAADAYGARVVGGNIASGTQLTLSTTVIGEAPERPLLRSGARAGDALYVTGTVGAAALGWRLLASDAAGSREAQPFVARWRRPRARFDVLPTLRDSGRCAIDVSDGVLADLQHLCDASGVGATVEIANLPLLEGHAELARSIGEDPIALALSGGEDYEILFGSAENIDPAIATRIGSFERDRRVRAIERDGAERTFARRGYRHR